jgi:hypothetical protein
MERYQADFPYAEAHSPICGRQLIGWTERYTGDSAGFRARWLSRRYEVARRSAERLEHPVRATVTGDGR